jgi:hypothetical protein
VSVEAQDEEVTLKATSPCQFGEAASS